LSLSKRSAGRKSASKAKVRHYGRDFVAAKSKTPLPKHGLVLVGGTFGPLHGGHALLLKEALKRGRGVCVGVMNDEMTQGKLHADRMPTFERRVDGVRDFFRKMNATDRVKISGLDGICGPEALEREAEAIVVTQETEGNAEKINEMRRRLGLSPLEIYGVERLKNEDGGVLSSTDIRKGKYDLGGKRTKLGATK